MGPRQFGGAKPRQLLTALLLHAGSPVSKSRLIELIWGAAPPAGATATLEAYVSVLRKRVEALDPGAAQPIRTVPGGYIWNVERADVDVVRFERLVVAARATRSRTRESLARYASALALVSRPVPHDEEDLPWMREWRQGHETRVLRVLVEAAEVALEAGDYVRAESWAAQALDEDPLLEPAWLVRLRSLELRGQHVQGLRAYETCRQLFAAELGCAPGPVLRDAFNRLLRGTGETRGDDLGELVHAVVRMHASLTDESGVPRIGTRLDRASMGLADDCTLLGRLLAAVSSRVLREAVAPS
ncbi:MAG TPA: BTAD domain-containing putative transcriptional regulator [Intrasporangium sp.]|uniref:AfsR/SARP family transcriptional regulator n=1 Tax=Intrasporangium sp. TaxID=1925024 RepID=UPI002D7821BB|nr:BTAD domain-containing putative transcriptional regulator [Intrasporangium sp.]HET7397744.1 BTAD domain-containing putative transcriptional regulator [Intrasporangium sp.]